MSRALSSYKYCIVPKCTNTTVTSNKHYFSVPKAEKLRNEWCRVMKRDNKTPLSYKSTLYCCEDHFDVKADVENFMRCSLVGGRMVLKCGVLPHKFECQQIPENIKSRSTNKKRRNKELNENMLIKKIRKSPENHPIEFVSCGNNTDDIIEPGDTICLPHIEITEGSPTVKLNTKSTKSQNRLKQQIQFVKQRKSK